MSGVCGERQVAWLWVAGVQPHSSDWPRQLLLAAAHAVQPWKIRGFRKKQKRCGETRNQRGRAYTRRTNSPICSWPRNVAGATRVSLLVSLVITLHSLHYIIAAPTASRPLPHPQPSPPRPPRPSPLLPLHPVSIFHLSIPVQCALTITIHYAFHWSQQHIVRILRAAHSDGATKG